MPQLGPARTTALPLGDKGPPSGLETLASPLLSSTRLLPPASVREEWPSPRNKLQWQELRLVKSLEKYPNEITSH